MEADKLEEHWTPTTIGATFALRQLPACTTRSHSLSIALPFRSHEWTFALSLSPEKRVGFARKSKPCNWAPEAFSFRQHETPFSWGNTSMQAELSLHSDGLADGEPQSVFDDVLLLPSHSDPISLGTVLLEHTPSTEVPIATTYRLPSKQTLKISLSVTISECPFVHGLFQAQPFSNDGEVQAQTELFRQSGDQVLGRSLTTGKLFDVKFLSVLSHSSSGSAGKLSPTYASLSVLEKHVSLPDSKLNEGWTAALKVKDDPDNVNLPHVREILCPSGYEYELDSDCEDEDEDDASSVVVPDASLSPGELSATISKDKQMERRSSGSLSSFELASDRDSADDHIEEIIQDSGGPSRLFPATIADCEQTVLIKFAAHRTWHAFLWYCYTGRVEFHELKSQLVGARRQRATHIEEKGPPSCSPKSMYRLADLVGNKDLKEKSLEAIKKRMTEANVLDEILSVYTSKYPDVRELQLGVLTKHCGSPEVKRAFLKTVMKHDNMPYVESVISAFYDRLVS